LVIGGNMSKVVCEGDATKNNELIKEVKQQLDTFKMKNYKGLEDNIKNEANSCILALELHKKQFNYKTGENEKVAVEIQLESARLYKEKLLEARNSKEFVKGDRTDKNTVWQFIILLQLLKQGLNSDNFFMNIVRAGGKASYVSLLGGGKKSMDIFTPKIIPSMVTSFKGHIKPQEQFHNVRCESLIIKQDFYLMGRVVTGGNGEKGLVRKAFNDAKGSGFCNIKDIIVWLDPNDYMRIYEWIKKMVVLSNVQDE